MLRHKIAALFVGICSLVILCSCTQTASQPHSVQIYALDTVIDLTAYGESAQQAVNAATAEIYKLEKLLSVTDENSDIYKLNNANGKEVTINPDTYRLLELAKNAGAQTQGRFDPTLYPVLKLWGFTQKEYTVPSEEEIALALKNVSCGNIALGPDHTATLQKATQVDLGGIAKGYIADKAADAMKEAGCTSGLISLGGNVRTIGEKPDGESWSIGIKDPEGNGYFATLFAQDCSVITSGAYQRNFTQDNVTYHHILDPETGKPSDSNALSVTIIGKEGAWCDALSTAIFVGGTEFAEEIQSNDFEYVILAEDGNIYASTSLKGRILPSDSSFANIIYK